MILQYENIYKFTRHHEVDPDCTQTFLNIYHTIKESKLRRERGSPRDDPRVCDTRVTSPLLQRTQPIQSHVLRRTGQAAASRQERLLLQKPQATADAIPL